MKKNQTWAECSWINQHMNDVFFFLFPPGFLSAGFCMTDAPTSRRREVQSLFRVHLTCKKGFPDPPIMIEMNETSLNYFQ